MLKKSIDFFIERSLIVNLLTVMIIIVGVFSIVTLRKELFPPVSFDVILVSTSYPGTSSEDVEKLVTIPIERRIHEVDGIKKMNALSAEGRSIVYVELDPDYELDEVLQDIKDKIDQVDDLPIDAKVPTVVALNNKIKGILKISLWGEDYKRLQKNAKALQRKYEDVPGVSRVVLDGYFDDEIRVLVDPIKLNLYEITVSDIKKSILNRNINLSAGKIEKSEGDIIVRTLSEFTSEKEIESLVIRSNFSGQNIFLKEVAKVVRQPKQEDLIQRSQGKEAIFLDVKMKESGDILITSDKVKKITENFFKGRSDNFRYTDDLSFFVKRRLNILKNNGILGIVLVFFALLLFLNTSTSIVTSMGAPVAFFASFIVMDFMGITINLISMFGLILVLGMLVDDSIIVSEHFYTHLENGEEPKTAAKKAAYQTVGPIIATVLTTMVAFGSMLFMGGIMGKFLWQVPVIVIICLMASLFECFYILPSHLADFCRLSKRKRTWYIPFLNFYRTSLSFSLKMPSLVVLGFFIILGGSFYVLKGMDKELFPGDDVRTVFLQLKGKVGTPLHKTDRAMKKLEEHALKSLSKKELDQIKAEVGRLRGSHGNKMGTHYGSLTLYLSSPDLRDRSTDEILSKLVKESKLLVPDFTLTILKMKGGPPQGKPLEIEIVGPKIQDLKNAAKEILALVEKEKGVRGPEMDFEEGNDQVIVKVNDQEVRRLGLTTREVAFSLREIMGGDSVTEIRESEQDIEIRILLNDEYRSKAESLNLLYIKNSRGQRIPLTKVASFEKSPGAFIIRRLNKKRIISITSEIDKKLVTPVALANSLNSKVRKIISKYDDLTFKFTGENEDTKESMSRLIKSGLISLFCIFLILVGMFSSLVRPIIVMMAIPLGLIGVIFIFKILGEAIGFMAMMGVIALIGVVVNDSIVLVNFIDLEIEKGTEKIQAIIEASVSRFRPVLLTTFTTVAGLLPVAHAASGDPFLKPMAKSFAWGLLLATFVTLIFVPCAYLAQEKMLDFFKRYFERLILNRLRN